MAYRTNSERELDTQSHEQNSDRLNRQETFCRQINKQTRKVEANIGAGGRTYTSHEHRVKGRKGAIVVVWASIRDLRLPSMPHGRSPAAGGYTRTRRHLIVSRSLSMCATVAALNDSAYPRPHQHPTRIRRWSAPRSHFVCDSSMELRARTSEGK